ncbi:addiction module antidote protein, HigA family [Acidiferrobacter sp. SPIII_3]|jgi:addiction module HigA family antidote|uniref:HigA family addiction module antitoxin n=1 Tax=Acidiferrobacter sp. SPIII_3 TaxID=1281578 RepID=UPI000D73A412|nr:HigA family addiction module antitoxin [Acidiferrobacter sp. SPIII_3]AWP23505.1 addiction module antidote protein, HigA family [Acidiferrobacter sp. SPIII_3]
MARKSEYPVTRNPKVAPTHPGEILREDVLPALGLSVQETARALRVSRQTLHRILAGTMGVSPEMAVRLGKFCGNGPGLWLRMQGVHDLWHAEQRMRDEVKHIPTRAA